MNLIATQQVPLDNALVAPEKRLKIEKCNPRIEFSKPQIEETYQVTLDTLKLSPYYPAFLITAEVPKIYLGLHNKDFVEPPSEEEMVSFIQEIGYSGKYDMLSAIHIDLMHQPWRTFATIINRCISRKSLGLDRLRLLRAQILWDIKDSKAYKTYLDFSTGKASPMKARKFKKVASPSKKLSPVLEEEPVEKPKRAKKHAKKSTTVPTAGVVIRDTASVIVSKKKTPTKVDNGKGMDLLSKAALLEAAQLKKTLKKSKLETHRIHASSSGDGVGSQIKFLDEQQDKTTSTYEGTCTKPGVPDLPKDQSESENES
ncbi:hypothetical protein Tco_0891150 [Tanacetum coccineum]|uniref:Uncharacterized protein n=1 Tax=Tanacetum coccineum TaxID=301880 RepID=A0ABQ5C5H6_9ASTR